MPRAPSGGAPGGVAHLHKDADPVRLLPRTILPIRDAHEGGRKPWRGILILFIVCGRLDKLHSSECRGTGLTRPCSPIVRERLLWLPGFLLRVNLTL